MPFVREKSIGSAFSGIHFNFSAIMVQALARNPRVDHAKTVHHFVDFALLERGEGLIFGQSIPCGQAVAERDYSGCRGDFSSDVEEDAGGGSGGFCAVAGKSEHMTSQWRWKTLDFTLLNFALSAPT
jgi:hypothetical protein